MLKVESKRDLQRLPGVWRAAPRLWGHSLHSLCSYMAMFPPTIPHVFVRWLTQPGEVVYDPFSGRGSTALEACLLGRIGFGSDANPLAWVLSAAKVDPPRRSSLSRRFAELAADIMPGKPDDAPEEVRVLFSRRTLGQLLWLREHLDLAKKTDRFIMAALLGILHANADSYGIPRGFTVSMPNTFSMAPGYVGRYIRAHHLLAPDIDVLPKLQARVMSLPEVPANFERGQAWMRDAAAECTGPVRQRPAKLLFSSPPYLQVMLYGKLNWIRLWLLGRSPKSVDQRLFTSSSVSKYVEFMRRTIYASRPCVLENGFACFVIGDVQRRSRPQPDELNLAKIVADGCVDGSGFRVLGIIDDHFPIEHKVSRIWGDNKGRATRVDRVLILGGPRARLPKTLPAMTWRN